MNIETEGTGLSLHHAYGPMINDTGSLLILVRTTSTSDPCVQIRCPVDEVSLEWSQNCAIILRGVSRLEVTSSNYMALMLPE